MAQTVRCDRCGCDIQDYGTEWGNCTKCGDDLCHECAGSFNEDGECEKCTIETKREDLIMSKGIPSMHSLSLHDVISIDKEERTLASSNGPFRIIDYTFSGAGFRFTVSAFMQEVE